MAGHAYSLERWCDEDSASRGAELQNLVGSNHRPQGSECVGRAVAVEDRDLGVAARVAQRQPHEEAVELALGQPVGALLLHGVLRRHHEERRGQRVGLASDGDLAFLHALEEGALDLGGGAVDFVGEDEVGEDRPVVRVDVFPDDLLLRGHFEYPPPVTFADQRIAIGKSLLPADVR